MDKVKKLFGSRQALLAAAVVMVLAGIFALQAAEKPERGYLGVSVQDLGSAERGKLGVKNGVEVSTVEKESAAAKAGIMEDDIILLVNGEKIRDARDLVEVISELAPGAAVKIGLWRDGKALEVTAALGKRDGKENFALASKKLPRIFRSGGYLGIVLQELNPDLAPYFAVKTGEGVLIVRVEKNTPADKAGLKAGDVIVQMGEKAVKDADAVHETLADLKKDDAIVVTVVRHGKKAALKAEPDFNRHERIIRIFRGCKDLDIEVPSLPDMSHIEEALQHVHEKLEQVKVKIEKRLDKISENIRI